jgi:hypothetical protein
MPFYVIFSKGNMWILERSSMDNRDYEVARRRVVVRFVLRLTFLFNLLFFLLIMLQLGSDIGKNPENILGTAFFVLIWGALLLTHGSLAFNLFGGLIDRAARRELEQQQFTEKPKRHRLELGEDGELNEVIAEWPIDESKPQTGEGEIPHL